jgi:DNA-binding transcriptional LysR family regulator
MDDWNDLRYFLIVAETGSLNAACKRLGVNHSTVFRRILHFEEQLGTRLFDRVDRRYQLTATGEQLWQSGMSIAHGIDGLSRLLDGRDLQLTGNIRITAPEYLAYLKLPEILRDFHLAYPGINIELITSSESLNMSRREADIALRATKKPPDYLIGKKLLSSPWNFYLEKDLAKKLGNDISEEQLLNYPFIGPSDQLLHVDALQYLEKHYQHAIRFRCNTVTGMAKLAEIGAGIALIPDDHASEKLQKITSPAENFSSDIWLLHHPDLRNNARVRACTEWLQNALT